METVLDTSSFLVFFSIIVKPIIKLQASNAKKFSVQGGDPPLVLMLRCTVSTRVPIPLLQIFKLIIKIHTGLIGLLVKFALVKLHTTYS